MTGGLAGHEGTVAYQFDRVSNRLGRLSSLAGVADQSLAYDANDRLTSDVVDANGNTVSSDSSGELLFDSYDFEDRLLERVTASGATVARYVYDGDGNRVAEQDGPSGSAIWRRFLVDQSNPTGYSQVVEEHAVASLSDASTTATLSVVYAYGHDLLAQHRRAEGQPEVAGAGFETHYFGYDALGTTRFLTDASGAVTDRFYYDAYGILLSREGSTDTSYLYTGERFTPALGLYHLRARYMNPGTGRFWTRDKWEGRRVDPITIASCLYANGNSVMYSDPSGYFAIPSLTEIMFTSGQRNAQATRRINTVKKSINRIEKVICKNAEIASENLTGAMNKHHTIFRVVGGKDKQKLVEIPEELHVEFHRIVRNLWKLKGPNNKALSGLKANDVHTWMRENPGKQLEALNLIREVSAVVDKTCGTKMTEVFDEMIKMMEYVQLR